MDGGKISRLQSKSAANKEIATENANGYRWDQISKDSLVKNWLCFPLAPLDNRLRQWFTRVQQDNLSVVAPVIVPVKYLSIHQIDEIMDHVVGPYCEINDLTPFKRRFLPRTTNLTWIVRNTHSLQRKKGPVPVWRDILRKVARGREVVSAKKLVIVAADPQEAEDLLTGD